MTDMDQLDNYYDKKPVRRGIYACIFGDKGHSKSSKILNKKGRRKIKKGNGNK